MLINHAQVHHALALYAPAYPHGRFLEPCTLAGPSTLALCFAFILPPPQPPKPCASNPSFPSTMNTVHMRRRRHAIHLSKQSMRTAVAVAGALLSSSSYILAGAHVLAATPSRFCA
ncbi:hypothetical protein B0H13DRAFT_2344374 [Mycena leptocephala]|nr:hypothetical protein B0H13DRAFT_2344374 [Mycena leptocephala]